MQRVISKSNTAPQRYPQFKSKLFLSCSGFICEFFRRRPIVWREVDWPELGIADVKIEGQ